MKVIRYTLLANGKIPNDIVDGGYFAKSTTNSSPQDNDLIGLSINWTGLEEYTTKISFENYIKSFMTDYTNPITNEMVLIQDLIDHLWGKL